MSILLKAHLQYTQGSDYEIMMSNVIFDMKGQSNTQVKYIQRSLYEIILHSEALPLICNVNW